MAAPYNPPKKNEDFQIRIPLKDANDPRSFKINPTIAAGDFQVDIDGAGFGNLTNLPSVSPAGTLAVLLNMTADQMNGDVISIRGVDQTNPKEWCDFFMCIPTTQ
jgi:hypothetical protein